METAYISHKKKSAPTFSVPAILRKLVYNKEHSAEKINRDYSVFGNVTAYERKVIDKLRADGLADTEIQKCLREL